MRSSLARFLIIALVAGTVASLAAGSPATASLASSDSDFRPLQGPVVLFEADLSGEFEVPPVDTQAEGRAVFALAPSGDELIYRIRVTELDTITMAHLHRGAPGENGPPVVWLYDASGMNGPGGDFGADAPLSATVSVSQEVVSDLMAGRLYVNIHTPDNPGGEIRGQLETMTLAPRYRAALSGANEVPPVDTGASGDATLDVSVETMTADVRVDVTDIDGITAAHLHRGQPGENGPPVVWLYDRSGAQAPGGAFDSDNPLEITVDLTPAQLLDLVAGHFYVNVHTDAHASGEIRGQVVPAPRRFTVLATQLSGDAEVPPVDTEAEGEAHFVLSEDRSVLTYWLEVDGLASATMAHLHLGLPGENGPPVIWLFDADGSDGPAGELGTGEPFRGTVALTTDQADVLLDGAYYLNVHTDAHPAGEIRGQVEVREPSRFFRTDLSGLNEVPPVQTDATGAAAVILGDDLEFFEYDVVVDDISGITAAHLHRGQPGENGPPVIWLYDRAGINAPGGPFDPDTGINGEIEVDQDFLLDLLAGNLYVNVHTEEHQTGEIRGQLNRTPRELEVFRAELSGSQLVPPVNTRATGRSLLAVGPDRTTLAYYVEVDDVEAVTGAAIHAGRAGESGEVLIELFDADTDPDPLAPDHALLGTRSVTEGQVAALTSGNTYVNVSTSAHKTGEIRGQVGLWQPPTEFATRLLGINEVPPVYAAAHGEATLSLTETKGHLDVLIDVADLENLVMAHLHRAAPGENGPPVVWLWDREGTRGPGGEFDNDTNLDVRVPLQPLDLVALLAGQMYINVHTGDHPAGAIRGQVMSPGAPQHVFTTDTSPGAEVPPIDLEAEGTATFVLGADGETLTYELTAEGLGTITMAHLHLGAADENGPPVVWLYDATGTQGPGGPFEADNPLQAQVELTAEQAAQLSAGDYYVNVHTEDHPAGALRGQVAHRMLDVFEVPLGGDAEVPPVATDALGTARLAFGPAGARLAYELTVTDISGITQAHIHRGEIGEIGPPVVWLYDADGEAAPNGPFGPGDPVTGTVSVDAELLMDMVAGNTYVNVHTEAYPAGEIRGQIGVEAPRTLWRIYMPYAEAYR